MRRVLARLLPERSIVLVVDVQERLLAAMDPEDAARVVAATTRLVRGAAIVGARVMYTEQYPAGLGPTESTVRGALEAAGAERFEKVEFDACSRPAVRDRLSALAPGLESAILAGMEAHICVLQTARALAAGDATRSRLATHVAMDAVTSRSRENVRLAEGLFVRAGALPSSVETVLFDWVAVGAGEKFKAISKLVR